MRQSAAVFRLSRWTCCVLAGALLQFILGIAFAEDQLTQSDESQEVIGPEMAGPVNAGIRKSQEVEVLNPSVVSQQSQAADTKPKDANRLCDARSQITVWVLGGTRRQGDMLCLNSNEPRLRMGPAFMTRVISQAEGFHEQSGLFDKIFLYQLGRYQWEPENEETPVFYPVKKVKHRMFDFQAMEFQTLSIIRARHQEIDTSPGREYVVFVKTPANNYWLTLLTQAISLGTNFATVVTGALLAN